MIVHNNNVPANFEEKNIFFMHRKVAVHFEGIIFMTNYNLYTFPEQKINCILSSHLVYNGIKKDKTK